MDETERETDTTGRGLVGRVCVYTELEPCIVAKARHDHGRGPVAEGRKAGEKSLSVGSDVGGAVESHSNRAEAAPTRAFPILDCAHLSPSTSRRHDGSPILVFATFSSISLSSHRIMNSGQHLW